MIIKYHSEAYNKVPSAFLAALPQKSMKKNSSFFEVTQNAFLEDSMDLLLDFVEKSFSLWLALTYIRNLEDVLDEAINIVYLRYLLDSEYTLRGPK